MTSRQFALVAASLVIVPAGGGSVHRQERVPAPLVISLDGSEPEFTRPEEGVRFDLDGDRVAELTAWTLAQRPHAFVCVDLNRNGRIDGGHELVGGAYGPPDGFRYLRAEDGSRTLDELAHRERRGVADGRFDAGDVGFGRLILWTDWNHDGSSQEDELQSAPFAEITSIDLRPQRAQMPDGRGNVLRDRSVGSRTSEAGAAVLTPVVTVHLARQAGG